MNKKHLFFAALFFAALAFGFVGCENPGDLLNNGDDSSITDNDSTTKEIIVIMAMNLNVLSLTYHLRW